ncbi:MAG: hypothetical protein LC640_05815, partial [Frankia sp.]|nr:hypothetical protein [Frankia sp.]
SGDYLPPRTLDSRSVPYTATIAAAGGRWWAVWSGGQWLVQAKTIGRPIAYERITGGTDYNDLPTLAIRADGSAVLLWRVNHRPYRGGGPPFSLRVATSRDGEWRSSAFRPADADLNSWPEVAVSRIASYAAWAEDDLLQPGDRTFVGFAEQRGTHDPYRRQARWLVDAAGCEYVAFPNVAVSAGLPAVAWQTCGDKSSRKVFVATRDARGAWSTTDVTPTDIPAGASYSIADLTSYNGKATVFMTQTILGIPRTVARTQP